MEVTAKGGATMERMMRIARGTGKVILALLGVALMPILIWVALGVVVYQKMRQRQVQRKPVPTIGQILVRAGKSAGQRQGY